MSMIPLTPFEKMIRARAQMLDKMPFWGRLATHLNLREMNISITQFGTEFIAATDGDNLFFNPERIDKLAPRQIIYMIAHEVVHCALDHLGRGYGMKAFVWALAIDIVVYNVLAEGNVGDAWEGMIGRGCALIPDKWVQEFSDFGAEKVYSILLERLENKMGCKDCPLKQQEGDGESGDGEECPFPGSCEGEEGAGGCRGASEGDKTTSASPGGFDLHVHSRDTKEARQKKAEWQQRVRNGLVLEGHTMQGTLPGGLKRMFEDWIDGKVPWHVILRSKLRETFGYSSWSKRKFERKYIHRGMYLPALTGHGEGILVAAIDTSGSVGQEELAKFVGELMLICKQFRSLRIYYMSCDAAIHNVVPKVRRKKDILYNLGGGGGTDFRPVFEHIQKRNIHPRVLVYFTDGWGTYPKKVPPYDVIWLFEGSKDYNEAPFGWNIVREETRQ